MTTPYWCPTRLEPPMGTLCTCVIDDVQCEGCQVEGYDRCLAHLDYTELEHVLSTLSPGSDFNAMGTTIDSALLGKILDSIRGEDGRPEFGTAIFVRANFIDRARFDHVKFEDAEFLSAHFEKGATFLKSHFKGRSTFWESCFHEEASFQETRFDGDAWFVGANFNCIAVFNMASFGGGANFAATRVKTRAQFDGVRFESAESLGPISVVGILALNDATFSQRVVVEAGAAGVLCWKTRFAGGVTMRLRHAEVELDHISLGAPSSILHAQEDMLFNDSEIAKAAADERERKDRIVASWSNYRFPKSDSSVPLLISLNACDAAELRLVDVDLTECRFAGAYHLDQLQFEGWVGFAQPPKGVRIGSSWPFAWWWTRRQIVADECIWRAQTPKSSGWLESVFGKKRKVSILTLEGIYRSLRKAREESKNEPGAADFYYGEMEMRRHSSMVMPIERFILTLYWLASGYGLRAARAILILIALLFMATIFLQHVGFADQQFGYWTSFVYLISSTAGVGSNIDRTGRLTVWGDLIKVIVRCSAPVLLGLAILAIRNRVRR